MARTSAEPLGDQVSMLLERVKELRRAGDFGVLVAAARDAADEIERRVGEHWGDSEREAMAVVRRFTFNAAADVWPGWSVTDKAPDTRNLLAAQELALRSVRLTKLLGLGLVQQATGIWLCGAFDLALGRYAEALSIFVDARDRYIAAEAPGLVLLMEGYIAIVRQISGEQIQVDAQSLDKVTANIAAAGFEDGAEWIEQLHTALKVFAR